MFNHIRTWLLFFMTCLMSLVCNGQSGASSSHNVLYINSYALGYSWSDSIVSGIQNELSKNPDVQIFIEFLDAKRFGNSHAESIFLLMKSKYHNIKFDVVITSDNDALDFFLLYGDQLAPGVPVVFCGINNIGDYNFQNSRYYGIIDGVDIRTEINLIVKLMPDIRKLYFITDNGTTSLLNLSQTRKLEPEYKGRLQFVYLQNYSLDSLRQAVQRFEPGNAIALINYYNDKDGSPLPVVSIYKEIIALSPVPAFVDFEAMLGHGIAGGIINSGSAYGQQTANLALQFIRNPGFVPENRIILPEGTYFFDNAVLQKFNISRELLPSQSTIINLPQKEIKANIIYILGLILLVCLLITIVLILYFSIKKRKKAEALIQQKLEEIRGKNLQLGKIQSRLNETNIQLEEVNKHLTNANESLILAKQKSEESDKLKSAFLTNISHQIRTPLNAIIGFSALLNDYQVTTKERAEYLRIIGSSSDQLLCIIDDILDLSKIEAGQLQLRIENFSVQELFDELIGSYKQITQTKQLDLKITHPVSTNHLMMMTDRTRLKQILGHLLSNAIKFTHQGVIEIGYSLDIPKEVAFFVKDTGVGIRPDDLKNIFSRFWKGDFLDGKTTSGAGVGLAICKKLSDALGAKIWAESDAITGTTFYIAFQDYIFKKAGEIELDNGDKASLTGHCIAIAEDEKDNMYLITRMLRNLDVKILQFQTGKEIVDYFKEGEHLKIDLILMDIKMPDMDGITAAKIIREIRPGIPIIAQTAYTFHDEMDENHFSSFDDYLFKPIRPMLLINKIKKFLAHATHA